MSNEMIERATAEVVAVNENALASLERASIDVQIATAHMYPRSMGDFKKRAITMATFDEETAQSCIYRRPVGREKDGRMKYAEGMSVRMAEIVGACYGNLRVGARIIQQTERQVVAQGIAHDLESNFLSTSEVVEATIDKNGRPYDERMRVVVAKAALAKARRDAIFQVVPKSLAKPIEQEVRNLLFGSTKSMAERRDRIGAWIETLPIGKERVLAALGVQSIDDIGMEAIETLNGLRTAITNGDVTLDEAFPEVLKVSDGGKPKALPKGDAVETMEAIKKAGRKKQTPEAEKSQLYTTCRQTIESAETLEELKSAEKFVMENCGKLNAGEAEELGKVFEDHKKKLGEKQHD